jgi:2-polyprenyl-6-methoxyphenol hydroxylase-like FAD-dependent oxidoreductase
VVAPLEQSPAASDVCDVLIVGAGPTGLVLALWLTRLGIKVRLIDKAASPGTTSRALVVHARTMELYQQLGIAGEVLARSLPFTAVNLWVRGKRVAHAVLGDLGRGLTPFPEMLVFPQDQHEQLLIEQLGRAGVLIERPCQLINFDQDADGVVARLRGADGRQITCRAQYLAGCDGAHSAVRQGLGIGFPGGTYERVFYVADVQLHGPVDDHELHLAMDDADFFAVFPMKGEHTVRLIGTIQRAAQTEQDLTWEDVSGDAARRMKITVDRVNWFSTYRVHHRVAERFRQGRAFLVGDAGHIHSPVGGQGMNTGIGDASNLGWKLAAVIGGHDPRLLDSYQLERIAFANRLVATTDRGFTLVTRDGPLARWVRTAVVPAVIPALLRGSAARRMMFRILSQTRVHYRGSQLSRGRAGRIRGGDRLPWVAPVQAGGPDNFTPLTALTWQLHVYGEAPPALRAVAESRRLPLHAFAWDDRMADAGLARDAAYLVRPDGYVGLADGQAQPETLERYLDLTAAL